MKLKHASFFTGIGGFDLAAQWCNWENVLQCEIDDFCQLVLERNFPNANRYRDIKQFDGKPWHGTIDIISGGFPCQPYSVAGKRRGAEDDRALWPEMLRVITEIQPAWFVGENVAGIVNMELDTVLSDLERIGYTCQAFVIPACAVNAPHRRDRVWIIANNNNQHGNLSRFCSGEFSQFKETGLQEDIITNTSSERREEWKQNSRQTNCQKITSKMVSRSERFGGLWIIADSTNIRLQHSGLSWTRRAGFKVNNTFTDSSFHDDRRDFGDKESGQESEFGNSSEQNTVTNANSFRFWRKANREGNSNFIDKYIKKDNWSNFPTQSPVCTGDDGISSGLVRYNDGSNSNIMEEKAKKRLSKESIKAAGNAIVPQVAYEIFQAINKVYNLKSE